MDPTASERGRLGVLFLQKAAEKAFRELGLWEVRVVSDSEQSELALCWKRAWIMGDGFNAYHNEADATWIGRLKRG